MMDPTAPTGGPYEAAVVVSADAVPVTDAAVSINGTPLAYLTNPDNPAYDGYVGLVSLTEGEAVTLTVSASAGEWSRQATATGSVEILTPTAEATYADGDDIEITWTPAEHAVVSAVACGDASGSLASTWLLQKDATSSVVPAASTAPPGVRISVIAMNGTGSFPSADLRQWTGLDGFWVGSQDWVDVQVNP